MLTLHPDSIIGDFAVIFTFTFCHFSANNQLCDCNMCVLFVFNLRFTAYGVLMYASVCIYDPTGIAVDKNGLIYFVDGTMIRKVDRNGIISTVLGSNDLTSARPLTCDNSMHIRQVSHSVCLILNTV